MRGSYNNQFLRGTKNDKLTVERNATVCQRERLVSRIPGEGRTELLRAWGPRSKQEGARHQGKEVWGEEDSQQL